MARKYIEVHDRNPYGDEIDEELLNDPGRDATFIAGYSDVRRQRELDARDGIKPKPLKHRLQWARGKAADGTTFDGKRMMHWQVKKGYKPLKYDDAIKLGYEVNENPAIVKGPDGLAWLGERVLLYADARTAATNLRKVQDANDAAQRAPKERMEAATERFNASTKGANATAFSFVGDDPDDAKKKRA